MDRILKEERNTLGMIKKIRATGCNVFFVWKRICCGPDAVGDLSLHYLAKAKILVIMDVEREDIEFISKTLSCFPLVNIEHFRAEKLGHADLVEGVSVGKGRVVLTGIENMGRTVSIVERGSSALVRSRFNLIRNLINSFEISCIGNFQEGDGVVEQ